MTHPLISVITITYNAGKTIGPTVESVAAQTFDDFEFILIDGASTDNTLRIVKESAIQLPRIFSSPDNGIYHAMNKGLSKALGTYVLFLNAGDSFHSPDTLRLLAEAALANNLPGIIYGQTDIVDSSRLKIADRHLIAPENLSLKSFASGMVVCHQAFMPLRKIAPQFNTRFRFSADYEWCIKCLQHSRNNLYVPATIVDYLSEGVTTANRYKSLMERFRIMCYYYGTLPTIIRHIGFIPRFFGYRKRLKSK